MNILKLSIRARIGELADTATTLINAYGTSGITEDTPMVNMLLVKGQGGNG